MAVYAADGPTSGATPSDARLRIGADALKPLKVIHRPRDSSQKKIGRVAIPVQIDTAELIPNSVPSIDDRSMGAPMSPSIGRMRGTSRDRYISVPSSRALIAGASPGPRANVQLRTATSDRPAVTRVAASAPEASLCRRLTTERMLTTPMTMTAASNIRDRKSVV